MRARVGHRQPGQTIILAAVALVAVVGSLAMVVDAGMFFLIKGQLQTAADAGALAGTWHPGGCPGAAYSGCIASASAEEVARGIALANINTISSLCNGTPTTDFAMDGFEKDGQQFNGVRLSVKCDATYSFGRILNLSTNQLSAQAEAVSGTRGTANTPLADCKNAQLTGWALKDDGGTTPPTATPPCGRMARLIPLTE